MRVGVADPKTDTKISIKNQTQEDIVGKAIKPHRIAFIGLGAMGFGMASWLVHEGFSVCGYDVSSYKGYNPGSNSSVTLIQSLILYLCPTVNTVFKHKMTIIERQEIAGQGMTRR